MARDQDQGRSGGTIRKAVEAMSPDKSTSALLLELAKVIHRTLQNPNEIEKIFRRPFVVDRSTLQNIYDIVEQRLNNDSDKVRLRQFELTIFFTEDQSRTFKSFDEFLSYNETKNILPLSLNLTWTVLMDFPNASKTDDTYERQEITVAFMMPDMDEVPFADRTILLHNGRGIITSSAILVNIEHTNRIWALDFLNHLEDFISTNVKQPEYSGLSSFMTSARNFWTGLTRFLLESIPFVAVFLFLVQKESAPWIANDTVQIQNTIYLVATLMTVGAFLFFVLHGAANKLNSYLHKILGRFAPRSYILVCTSAQTRYARHGASLRKSLSKAIFWLIGTIIINVGSNMLFAMLFSRAFG